MSFAGFQLKKLIKNPFLRGSFIFTLTSFVANVLHYIFNLIVARSFPLTNYGEYMTAISYFLFFTMPVGALSVVLIKKIGSLNPKIRKAYVINLEGYLISQIKRYLWLIAMFAVLLVLFFYFKANLTMSSIILIVVTTFIGLLAVLYNASLQVFKQFFLVGLVFITVALIKIIGIAGVSQLRPNLNLLYLIIILASLVGLFLARYFLKRDIGQESSKPSLKFKFQTLPAYLKRKSILLPAMTTLGMAGILTIDVILAKIFLSSNQVGLYAGLSLLAKIVLYTTTPIITVAFTFFASSEHRKHQTKNLLTAVFLFLIIGLLLFIAYKYFAQPLVLLVFGAKFLSLAPIIWWSAIFGLLYSLTSLFARFLIAKENWLGLASLFFLGLQIIAISLYHTSFVQIMQINIIAVLGLLLVYLGVIVLNSDYVKNY